MSSDSTISALSVASALTGAEIIPIDQGSTKQAQLSKLFSDPLYKPSGTVGRSLNNIIGDVVNVKNPPFNAVGDGVTDDTAAVNASNAASRIVGVPTGTYLLSALANISGAANFRLYGDGRTSLLKFNTTGKCIQLGPFAVPTQNKNVHIHDLAFTNVTNTPTSYISQENYVNSIFERLYWEQNAAGTYGIDQVSGYGTKISDCVWHFFTGTPIRLRDNGSAPNYSFVATIDHVDITSPSGNGIEVEATNTLRISNSVIESCGGDGIVTSTNGVSGTTLQIDNVDFEGNTGYAINLGTNGGTYWGRATVTNCNFANGERINLGSKSKIVFIGCQSGTVTVVGSANAEAYFIGCQSSQFTQSGSFLWSDPGNTVSYNPTVTNVTTSAKTTEYIRNGREVTYRGRIVVSAAPTGVIKVSLPVAATTSVVNVSIGSSFGFVNGGYYTGIAWLFDANTLEIHSTGAANEWSAATPAGWINGDFFDFTVSYFT